MSRETLRKKKKPEIKLTGVALTSAQILLLKRMSQESSDSIGRRVSSSQVLRAILTWVQTQDISFAREEIIPIVERELLLLRWGRQKES